MLVALGSQEYKASLTLCPTKLCLLPRLLSSSLQVTQWLSAHFAWDIFWLGEHRQGRREPNPGTLLPQGHPATSWRQEVWETRNLSIHTSHSAPKR